MSTQILESILAGALPVVNARDVERAAARARLDRASGFGHGQYGLLDSEASLQARAKFSRAVERACAESPAYRAGYHAGVMARLAGVQS